MTPPLSALSSQTLTEDAGLATVLTRIEVKLDSSLARAEDHEFRIRLVESRRTVSPRDLWLGLTGAVGAAAALSSILSALNQ